jgi:diguanylate cyclase (GGDEF)-like protein/PAS domain S-box-containing protein
VEAPKDLPIRLQDLGIGRLFESVRDAVLVAEADTGQIVLWNSTATQILGYSQSEALRKRWDVLVPERFKAQCRAGMARYRDTGHGPYIDAHTVLELPALHKSGEEINIEITLSAIEPVHDLVGASKRLVLAIIRDITGRKQTEEALKESEERFRTAFEDAPIGVALIGLNGRYLRVNRALCDMLGYSEEELLEKTPLDLTHPDDLGATAERMRQVLEEGPGSYTIEKRYVRADGQVLWILSSVSLIQDPQGKPSHFISLAQDISDRKALEEQLKHRAFHDSLTELPNRTLFLDRLEHALARIHQTGGPVAVLLADLDDFKVINDSLGHDAGNTVLVEVAERLKGAVRPGDTVARLFGDEFAVLLEAPAGREEVLWVTEKIMNRLREPFDLNEQEAFVTPSIGIYLSESTKDEPVEVLRHVDWAMYTAKERGKARYEVYNPRMNIDTGERMRLRKDLYRAVEREEFEVYYQPQVELRTNKMVGVEALVRWKHPDKGLLPATQFITLAEQTGLIDHIGRWVLQESCRQLVEWQEWYSAKHGSPLGLSVNLSAREIQQPDLAETVADILRQTGLDPSCITLEVSERIAMKDAEYTIDKLRELKDLGVKLALDDFGTGYCSLVYLEHSLLDALKIDRVFIHRERKNPEEYVTIISAMLSMARSLGLEAIVEGVETEEQLAKLREMRCEMAQGYYFANPLSSEAIERLLVEGTKR